MISLPVRTEYGFKRLSCACKECSIPCQHMPGFLCVHDLPRMMQAAGYDDAFEFARDHLLASPGAKVGKYVNGKLETFYIPTLVPNRNANGACHWLDAHGRCVMHSVSPYGCAFYSSHITLKESNKRTSASLVDIMQSHRDDGLYGRVWKMLQAEGKTAPGPERCRREMSVAWEAAQRPGQSKGHMAKKERNRKRR